MSRSVPCRLAVIVLGVVCAAMPSLTARAVDLLIQDNGPYITSLGNGFGGANLSQAATTNSIGLSFAANLAPPNGPVRVADDFVIQNAPGGGQRLSRMEWFATQSQSSNFTTNVTWTAAYVAIYSGDPSLGGALLAGDFTTNRLISTTWSGVYRVGTGTSSTTLLSQTRPIMKLDIDMSWAPALGNGSYWIVVSAIGETTRTTFAFSFPATPFRIGDNGYQFFNGSWIALTADFPFRLFAKCPADTDGNSAVTIDDIFEFLGLWFVGSPRADIDASGSATIDDIFVFLNRWFAGC